MSASGGGRVLIVDSDSEFRLKLYKRLLDRDVFSDTVGDSRDAISRLIHTGYSVVVLDLALAQAGAERILDAIIDQPRERRPVVLVIAPPGAARSLDVEVVQIVLRRPCDMQQLSDMVQSCVRIATAAPHPRSDADADSDHPVV